MVVNCQAERRKRRYTNRREEREEEERDQRKAESREGEKKKDRKFDGSGGLQTHRGRAIRIMGGLTGGWRMGWPLLD